MPVDGDEAFVEPFSDEEVSGEEEDEDPTDADEDERDQNESEMKWLSPSDDEQLSDDQESFGDEDRERTILLSNSDGSDPECADASAHDSAYDGSEDLGAKTYKELRDLCRENQIALTGKKQDLVNRLSVFYKERTS